MDFEEFVLAAATSDLSEEPLAREHADAIEFRMDLAQDPRSALETYSGRLEIIATNRVESEGGGVPASPERIDTLEAAAEHPLVGAIDIELETIEHGRAGNLLSVARDRDTDVVVSTHDFDGTPDVETMTARLERACEYGDVGKLAVTADSPGDTLALLRATWTGTRSGLPVATMAMGEAGQHSRVVAPLYGSRIGYAPVSTAGATAPGQYDLSTLSSLLERLGGRTDLTKG